MNFKQLLRCVNSEKEAVRFYQDHHIFPGQMECANSHQMFLFFKDRIC